MSIWPRSHSRGVSHHTGLQHLRARDEGAARKESGLDISRAWRAPGRASLCHHLGQNGRNLGAKCAAGLRQGRLPSRALGRLQEPVPAGISANPGGQHSR